MTKSKPKPVKPVPVLAWCLLGVDEPINPRWCCATRERAEYWRRNAEGGMDGRVIRVEIRPAPKRKSKRTKP